VKGRPAPFVHRGVNVLKLRTVTRYEMGGATLLGVWCGIRRGNGNTEANCPCHKVIEHFKILIGTSMVFPKVKI
jgi:hypothetical protein